jgi:hypothetical protein
MRAIAMLVVLAACGPQADVPSHTTTVPPSRTTSEPPTVGPPPRTTSAPPPASPVCSVMIQPSRPGHTSVEPDDMICSHGDAALDCPAAFDGVAHRCNHALPGRVASARGDVQAALAEGRLWCCPATYDQPTP